MAIVSNDGTAVARVHRTPFGTDIDVSGHIRFRVFAPAVSSMRLKLEGSGDPLPMQAEGDGWYSLTTSQAAPGARYRFLLPDGAEVPDPASRYQPRDVHGPSEVIDPAGYRWQDAEWRGRPWHEAILYELHVGTFTPEGTFRSAIRHLDYLQDLGITAIELMCLADFAGNRNWGYDGVLLYAPDSAYGRPEEMKAFIDAAHARGIMIVLDVVYNHLGPEGNYLPLYFPQLLSDRHCTPWGQALNFDGEHSRQVRDLIIENALYWVDEFHVDGLRLDASHAMIDESSTHILDDLRSAVLAFAGDRIVHLILENEQNISDRLTRDREGRELGYTAQWNHDITHLLAAVLGKPCEDRRDEDAGETGKLGQALAEGFVIAARESGRTGLNQAVPPTAFVAFIQTHDLVGNRIFGDRISSIVPVAAVRAIASIYLLLPQIPMLFMGEEWAASTPFPFFCDYHGDLADAVRKGRCDQLAKLDPAPSADEMKRAPDPQAESTLRSAQLHWDEPVTDTLTGLPQDAGHAETLDLYKHLLQVRRQSIVPLLADLASTCGSYEVLGPGALKALWILAGGAQLHLALNLCAEPHPNFGPAPGQLLWLEGRVADGELGPWSVRWSLEPAMEGAMPSSSPC